MTWLSHHGRGRTDESPIAFAREGDVLAAVATAATVALYPSTCSFSVTGGEQVLRYSSARRSGKKTVPFVTLGMAIALLALSPLLCAAAATTGPTGVPADAPAEARREPDSPLLETLAIGVVQQEQRVATMTFDFQTRHALSKPFAQQLAEQRKDALPPELAEKRDPSLEETLDTGTARYASGRMYVQLGRAFKSDGKVIDQREVSVIDQRVVDYDKVHRLGSINAQAQRTRELPGLDPRRALTLFADGQSVGELMTGDEWQRNVHGPVNQDGVQTYRVDLSRKFQTPEGAAAEIHKSMWISPERGFLVTRAISYDVDDPGKVFSISQFETKQVDGAWVYAGVKYETYPLGRSEPDAVTESVYRDVRVNIPLRDADFAVDLADARYVFDAITQVHYEPSQVAAEVARSVDGILQTKVFKPAAAPSAAAGNDPTQGTAVASSNASGRDATAPVLANSRATRVGGWARAGAAGAAVGLAAAVAVMAHRRRRRRRLSTGLSATAPAPDPG